MLTLLLAFVTGINDTDKLGDPPATAAADKLGEPSVPGPLPASLRLPPVAPTSPVYEITLPLYPDAPTRADLEPIGAKLDAVQVSLKAMADARRPTPASPPAKANPCVPGCERRCPGDCNEDGCHCRSAGRVASKAQAKSRARTRTRTAPPVKRWYTLTNEPGVQGYGALNAQGQVVVEQRRSLAGPFQPALYPWRGDLQLQSPCAGGRCGR